MAPQFPKKVLLVNYAGYLLGANTFIPDNSLGSLAAMLLRHGVPVEILDLQSPAAIGSVMDHAPGESAREVVDSIEHGEAPSPSLVMRYHEDRRLGEEWLLDNATRSILRKIRDEEVGIVGFKLWAGEGIRGAIRVAEAIRAECSDVLLVAGGPAVQYCGETLREITGVFDCLVPGEGEHAIALLATERLGVAGPCDRRTPIASDLLARAVRDALVRDRVHVRPPRSAEEWPMIATLDDLPFPTTNSEVHPGTEDFYRVRVIDETRGCFNSCAFCAHTSFNGHGTRRRTAAAVVDEMARLQRTEGVSFFRFSGSNPPWKLLVAIAEEILSRRLDVYYSAFASPNNIRPEHFDMLKASGLCGLFVGVESGDTELLRRAYNKDNGSREHVVNVSRAAMRSGLFLTLSFIVPGPFETEATKRATQNLIAEIFELHNHGSVLLLPPMLEPRTRWWANMEEYGFAFAPGTDRRSYVVDGVQRGSDYLLPYETWADFGYRLNGKAVPELLAECAEFSERVERSGILTRIDDAGYLLALMGDLEPRAYKRRVLSDMILGGVDRLNCLVQTVNHPTERAKKTAWAAKPQTSTAA